MPKNFTALTNRAAMAAARTAARYASEKYTPIALETMSNREVTSELSRARAILRKRAGRAGEYYTGEQARRIQDLLRPVKDVPMSERAEQLSAIARELSSGTSGRAEARSSLEKAVKKFQQAGYDFVTMENIREYLEFQKEFSYEELDRAYGSGTTLEYFEKQKARQARGDAVKVSRRSFLIWLSKQEA